MPETVKVFQLDLTEEELYCLKHLLADGPGRQIRNALKMEHIEAEEVLQAVSVRVGRAYGSKDWKEALAVTKEDLEKAVPWQVFQGPAVSPAVDLKWDLFSGFALWDEVADSVAAAAGLRIVRDVAGEAQNPCKEDDYHYGDDSVSDYDACLAYLRSGGTLMFCPDDEEQVRKFNEGKGRVYGRFVAVEPA